MVIKEEQKEKFIEELNLNYRTILSYGEDGLIPAGEFIVKDIGLDDVPVEYDNGNISNEIMNMILSKIDDENVKIVLPVKTFLEKYIDLAKDNANKLSIGSDLSKSLQDVGKIAESKVMSDETLQELVDVKTISLEESGADYLINGEVQSTNYSICPVDLGKYRERIRGRDYFEEDEIER